MFKFKLVSKNERIISKVNLVNTKVESIMGSVTVNVISTPEDIAKFTEALFLGKLVSSASVEQMKFMVDDYVVKQVQ